MHAFCLYLLPLFAVFITLVSCYLVYRVALGSPRWRNAFMDACAESIARSFPLKELAQQRLDESALHSLMERRYDGFIAALKKRIPMADMLMTGVLEAGLKEQVQAEISKLLPELKQQLVERLMNPDEVQAWVKAYLQQQSVENLSGMIPRKYRLILLFSLVAISFSFGLVQLLLILFLC